MDNKDTVEKSGVKKGDVVLVTFLESTRSEDEEYSQLKIIDYERLISRNMFGIVERIDDNSIIIITEYTCMVFNPIINKGIELDKFSDVDSTSIVRSSIINITKYLDKDLYDMACKIDSGDD